MKVLVGCERSGIVREAFRRRGHDAWSCDLVPAVDRSPYHYQCNLRDLLREPWDILIAHPECRYLSNSGVLRLYIGGKKSNGPNAVRWQLMQEAAAFFRFCLDARIPKICIENPVMHRYAKMLIGKPWSQTIQPWQFGEDASKRTCLWLKGLPPLKPVNVIIRQRYANQTPSGQNKLGPASYSASRYLFRYR